jgi:gamma-glutamyltranspeptidase
MTNPLIVLKNGKPVLASSCTGVGVHEVTVQNICNVLDYGMDPQTAEQAPKFGIPVFRDEDMTSLENLINRTEYEKQFMGNDFSPDVLEDVRNLGQELEITPPSKDSKASIEGYGRWAGIQIDQKAGKLLGGVHSGLNGLVEGY